MLRHLNNNLLNVRSPKSFQHLLHQIEHPNWDLHFPTVLKISLVSSLTTPKVSLTTIAVNSYKNKVLGDGDIQVKAVMVVKSEGLNFLGLWPQVNPQGQDHL